jgi:hypothetical protein
VYRRDGYENKDKEECRLGRGELLEAEREVTRAEKVLALTLAIFLLIGGLRVAWAINGIFPYPDYMELRGQFVPAALEEDVNALLQREGEKLEALQRLREEESTLLSQYEIAREEYRTLLDRGIDDAVKKARWEQARASHEETLAAISAAETALQDFQANALGPKQQTLGEYHGRLETRFNQLTSRRNLQAGLALMVYALAGFALTLWIFNLFRSKPLLNRYGVIGTSFLLFGALQMLAITYYTGFPFLRDLLPIEWIISIAGSSLSIAGIVFLKNRYLSAEAVRNRRLWKKACPVCGFSQPGSYCIHCGAEQTHNCSRCGLPTNKFALWCRECGGKQE